MNDLQDNTSQPQSIKRIPLVSVVIPAYNAERFVLEAIRSVDNQGYAAMEILLIDDGSKDGTVDLVRHSAPHVKIIQQANAGASAARNRGLQAATGDYICFLDADDGWFPGKIAAQVAYLEQHPEIGACFHRWLVWKPDADGVFRMPQRSEEPVAGQINPEKCGWIYCGLLLDCIVHTSSVMLRNRLVQDVGLFRTDLATGEDYDYWLRAARSYQFVQLTGIYSFYRAAPGSLTAVPRNENNEYRVISAAVDRWGVASPDGSRCLPDDVIRTRLSNLAFDFAYGHYHRGTRALSKPWFAIALRHRPWRWRALIYWLLASLG